MKKFPITIVGAASILLIAQLSCNYALTAVTDTPLATPTSAEQTPASLTSPSPPPPTPTLPEATSTITPPSTALPSATPGPQCIVLQDLNLRSGPGTAYNPPIRALPAQTKLTPTGFNPEGIPGGSWAQVKDEANNQIGWVSAGTQFISCNIDLATLPSVVVPPPPPPPPPNAENSDPDGTFPENLIFEADFDSQYLLRLYAYDENSGSTEDGAGISAVIFTVTDANNNILLENSEETAGFCIFGGGEPNCNPWTFEDFVYKWAPGGAVVEDGTYNLEVKVILEDVNSDQGRWDYTLTIDVN